MTEFETRGSTSRRTAWAEFLGRPRSTLSCAVGWIVATSLFGLLTRLAGGVTTSDSYVSVNSSLAIAHGYFSCAYPPQSTLPDNPLAPPFYPLISGALSALFRIGHALPFPSAAQMGPHCSNAVMAIGNWIVPTGALFSVVLIGYVGWLFLAAGVVALLRASGRGRCAWETLALLAVACTPPVIMCLNEYFHPQDLIAVGLALAGLASVLRERWLLAGILMGVAFTSQQFALLFVVPTILVAPRRCAQWLVAGFVAAVAVIDGPLLIVTSGRAFKATLVGTGLNTNRATWLGLTHLTGDPLFAISRCFPIILAVALALWIRRSRDDSSSDAVTLLSLIAASLTLRLIFEINLWGYYFMAVSVVLIARQVIRGRVSWWFVLWLSVVTYAAINGGLANRPALTPLPISLWQVILVPWVLALSLAPLRLDRAASIVTPKSNHVTLPP